MTTSDILYDIICLPRHFNETGDKSIHTLLVETGYADIRDQITINAIRNSLSKHPECVPDWIQYSEDKRAVGGWYFKEGCSGKFIVGCLADGVRGEASRQSYDDKMDACAVFVKREIDCIKPTNNE